MSDDTPRQDWDHDWKAWAVRAMNKLIDEAEEHKLQLQAEHDQKFPNGPPLNPDDDPTYLHFLRQIRAMKVDLAKAIEESEDTGEDWKE